MAMHSMKTGLKLASLRGESSNQLLETLEEWNDYLERENAPARQQPAAMIGGQRGNVSKGFPGSFRLYLDESSRQVSSQSWRSCGNSGPSHSLQS